MSPAYAIAKRLSCGVFTAVPRREEVERMAHIAIRHGCTQGEIYGCHERWQTDMMSGRPSRPLGPDLGNRLSTD